MLHTSQQLQRQHGFTLIEVMVVIVIMGIMATLVILNIDGVDQRKALQAREVFIMDLKRIQRESNDQSRIFALDIQAATDISDSSYTIKEYFDPIQSKHSLQTVQKWREYSEFSPRYLPRDVSFKIDGLNKRYNNAQNRDLIEGNSPRLIWLGNGEVKPVRIQFYLSGRELGSAIEIDHLGKIADES